MQDYYTVLGVSRHADPEVIKAAYRALAKKYHPDSSGGSAERFLQISRAWEVLSDPDLRRAYDQTLSTAAAQKPSPEVKGEHRSFFAKVQYAAAALLVFGVGGAVPLLLLALTVAAIFQAVAAIFQASAPTSPPVSPPASAQSIEDQQIQSNGLTKATNEFLREISKKPTPRSAEVPDNHGKPSR
jgi:curved DNA-binding protein CbpA